MYNLTPYNWRSPDTHDTLVIIPQIYTPIFRIASCKNLRSKLISQANVFSFILEVAPSETGFLNGISVHLGEQVPAQFWYEK